MSFPNIPNITASITITRDNVLNLLLASIAFEELGLSHIINAEGEKIQYALGLIPGLKHPSSITDLLNVNDSVRRTLDSVTKKELVLQSKLQNIIDLLMDEKKKNHL
ncbi:hypothetical protein [Lysinibacillus sp. Bpr_S20]|uniref:hypothetical protein n=1 Tax=Lysinibacillus sp. Bpr_S20 TaxID=2933964 RepID=UPI0032C406F6